MAVHYVLACFPRYRLPETTRWAYQLASGKEVAFMQRPVDQPIGGNC